jgi:hypothetical protein
VKRPIGLVLGTRKPKQDELFVPTAKLAPGPGHPFCTRLNEALSNAGFDEFVEKLCAPYCKEGGRPCIPPVEYFRMLFIGYFEDFGQSTPHRLALRRFLGIAITEDTSVHASRTDIRQRLPESVFDTVFVFVLSLREEHACCAATRWRLTPRRGRPTRR